MIFPQFENMVMRLFILRIGNNKADRIYRLAYGVFRPCLEKMTEISVSDSSAPIFNCEFGKIVFRKVIWASDRDSIMGIFDDMRKGLPLKASFEKWGINTERLDFDVVYNQDASYLTWGIENVMERQLTYIKSVCMLEPERLLEKNDELPSDVDSARKAVEDELTKITRLPFDTKFDHLGNMDMIIEPDRDENGKQLVEYTRKNGKLFEHQVKVKHELTDGADEVTVNVRFGHDERVMSDQIVHFQPDGKDQTVTFTIKDAPTSIETKVWLKKNDECNLVHQTLLYLIHTIHFSMSAVGGRMKVTSDWMQKIRKNLPAKNKAEADKAESIEHKSTENFSVGKAPVRRIKREVPIKTNDEFFPKGWDSDTNTQGMLSFIDWFRRKAERARSIFLQDPYFEDVALYLIASTNNQECEYMVLTQTRLKTNSDGTVDNLGNSSEEGERKNKIVNGIKANPLLFEPMKLIVKDVEASHNALHDRYMIFDYGDNHLEGYMLSNSLQGATIKQPLLITQIGDYAFEKVRCHIEETLSGNGIETIYDYQARRNDEESVKSKEIADPGFYNWLEHEKVKMLKGNVEHLLEDIKTWKTKEKLATFGYFLANTEPKDAYRIFSNFADVMQRDGSWIGILSSFILKLHYSPYPVGYIHCPRGGYVHFDCTNLLALDYQQIVRPIHGHLIDNMWGERCCFRVYGQYYAVKLLLRLSVAEAVDVLKKLRPTLINIKTDKTITPVYKVTLMLMSELMETAAWKQNEVMKALMADGDSWCRGIGSLMFLHRAMDDLFKCENYSSFFKNEDELVSLCHTEWGMKSVNANKEVFVRWLVDVFKRKNDADYFKAKFGEILTGCYAAEDKAEYIEKVVKPLICSGLVDKDELSVLTIDTLYDNAICGQYRWAMKEGLVEILYALDGDIQKLYDKSDVTLEKYKKRVKSLTVHDDEEILRLSSECIELRVLLLNIIKKYEVRGNAVICKLQSLLEEVDKCLDDAGLKKAKRMFED